MLKRAVFLDRDGTLIRNREFSFRPNEIELMYGVEEGLRLLQAADYSLIVVTNQAGVAKGLFTEQSVLDMHRRIDDILSPGGISIAGFYFCPHHPEGSVAAYATKCDCRKPRPGLILKAADEIGIDASKSWLIGDIMDDVLAGYRAGCRTVLVNGWYERLKHPFHPHPQFMTKNFLEAARYIVAKTN